RSCASGDAGAVSWSAEVSICEALMLQSVPAAFQPGSLSNQLDGQRKLINKDGQDGQDGQDKAISKFEVSNPVFLFCTSCPSLLIISRSSPSGCFCWKGSLEGSSAPALHLEEASLDYVAPERREAVDEEEAVAVVC